MPYVLVWNRAAVEDKMVRLAAWLGLADRSFDGVLQWVLDLRREIGIPTRWPRSACARARRSVRAPGAQRPLDRWQPAADDREGFRAALPELHQRRPEGSMRGLESLDAAARDVLSKAGDPAAAQRALWSELAMIPHGFVLCGGTAIASIWVTASRSTSISLDPMRSTGAALLQRAASERIHRAAAGSEHADLSGRARQLGDRVFFGIRLAARRCATDREDNRCGRIAP